MFWLINRFKKKRETVKDRCDADKYDTYNYDRITIDGITYYSVTITAKKDGSMFCVSTYGGNGLGFDKADKLLKQIRGY